MAAIGVRFAFANPFSRNHCVVHALTHLSGGDHLTAVSLANKAYAAGRLTHAGRAIDTFGHLAWWTEAAGLRVVRKDRLLRAGRHASLEASAQFARARGYTLVRSAPTLTTFARRHRRGRFLVFVRGHAVAVIDGVIFGSWRPRSQVISYAEVE